jgi:lysophospholipase L1-like esterase
MTKAFIITTALAAIALITATPALAQTASTGADCPAATSPLPSGMRDAMLKPGAKSPFVANPQANDPMFASFQKRQAEERARDYANLCRFKADNARLMGDPSKSPRIVFMGDSITEGWEFGDPSLFASGVADRGIGGQTSTQMLVRFYQDVIGLKPRVVHIMAGTNDVAGNGGRFDPEDYKNHIRAMVELAQTHKIQVVLASIPPAGGFVWKPELKPAETIRALNAWMKSYAAEKGVIYADYHTVLTAPDGSFKPELSNDGIHPHTDGYAIMRPVADAALSQALK